MSDLPSAGAGSGLSVHLFGTMRVILDGEEIRPPSRKPRGILALLALHAGHPVSIDRLIDGIWGEEPPDTAANALQVYIAGLRRALGSAGSKLVTRSPGYVLDIDARAVDVLTFEADVATARGQAVATWRAALALWTGDPLADLAGLPFAAPTTARLMELRLDAAEASNDAALAAGETISVVKDVEALLVDDPYRERLWRQLMLALYRSGRQADALAAYRRARHVLAEELGLDPGPALVQLERAILAQDPALEATPSGRALGVRLPAQERRLVGRNEMLREVRATLGRCRLVTLVGPGGVGKTCVAVEAARDQGPAYPDGLVFVDLTASKDADEMLSELSRACDFTLAATTVEALAASVSDRRILMVLDNLEQIDAAADVVAELLARAPQLTILATSRTPLRVRVEEVVRIPTLGIGDASELFETRLRSMTRGRVAPDTVLAIVERLDGLPLAIELAAAACRGLPPADVLRRLGDRLPLPDGARDLPSRQRTLEATLQWSLDLLEDSTRDALSDLATFEAPFTARAAGRLVTPEERAMRDLVTLVDSNLLSTSGDRYRMMVSVRDHVRGLDTGAARRLRADRHAQWLLDEVAAVAPGLHGENEVEVRSELARSIPDIRTAVTHLVTLGRQDDAARILVSTLLVWFHEGLFAELDRLLGLASAAGPLSPPLDAEVAVTRGVFSKVAGRTDEAYDLLREGVAALARATSESSSLLNGHCHLAALDAEAGRAASAFTHAEAAINAARRSDDPAALPMALDLASYVARVLGDSRRAVHAGHEAVELARTRRAINLPEAQAGYAAALARNGDGDEAVAQGWEAIATAEIAGSPTQIAEVTVTLSEVLGPVDREAFAPLLASAMATRLAVGATGGVLEAGGQLLRLLEQEDPRSAATLIGALRGRADAANRDLGESVLEHIRERIGSHDTGVSLARGAAFHDDAFGRWAVEISGSSSA